MRSAFKKIFLTFFTVVAIFIAGLGAFAWLRQDQLTGALVEKINRSLNTKISYGTMKVNIFEAFPNITVRFNDLLVTPSKYYNRKHLAGENNDTLLYVSALSLAVDLPSLVTGTVAVRSITARDGELNVLTDRFGNINYEIFFSESGSSKGVRLNSITAKNIATVYSDRESDVRIAGIIKDSNISGEIFSTGIFLTASLDAGLSSLDVSTIHLKEIPATAEIRVRKSENSLSIAKGSLDLAGLSFSVDGTVNYRNHNIDMVIRGKEIDIADVVSIMPEKVRKVTSTLNPGGMTNLTCIINGPYGDAGSPGLDVSFSLSHGTISNVASALGVNDLSFRGGITSPSAGKPEMFEFRIDTLNTAFGSAYFAGSFSMKNLTKPEVRLSLQGDIIFEDLKKLLKSDLVKNQEGSVSITMKLNGVLPDSLRFSVADLPSLNPVASFVFRDFGATIEKSGIAFSGVNGSVAVNEHLKTDSLSITLADQHFLISAGAGNFIAWLAGKPVYLDITGMISADRFTPEVFTGTGGSKKNEDKSSSTRIFPDDVTMNVTFRADSLINKKFRAANFTSTLKYRPYMISFSDIRAEGLDGFIAGDLMIGKQPDLSFISRGNLEVKEIDISKTFSAFNNFGQKFIVSENLNGTLTGRVVLLTPLDNKFNIITKTLIAEAHLSISDGRLTDFSPAESLSSFIDLDELKDISFSKLENDLFIRNRSISIPKMLINSSAGNFTIFGTHTFDGDYTYHIRVLLSEVLSRQARESHRNDASFGKVTVDGSGKATIPLKIVCQNDKTSVSYDFGQAQDNLKENIATEKQSLKGILNEEYGWYKGDTAKKKPEEAKPKFTITWDEGKVQKADTIETEEPDLQSAIRDLFRK